MTKKLIAVCLTMIFLSLGGVLSYAKDVTPVGFTSDQIFSIIEDRDPDIRFEAADRFSQIFGG